MRKIIHRSGRHNRPARGRSTVLAAAVAIPLILAGCDQGGRDEAAGGRAGASGAGPAACGVTVDGSAWTGFVPLADSMAAGHGVPRAELETWAALPAVAAWRRVQTPNSPTAGNVANWLEAAWWDELGRTDAHKANANRSEFRRTYRYSQEQRQRIDGLLAEFTAGDAACRIHDLAASWVAPERMPAGWRLVFLPNRPEVRVEESEIFVDTGLLAASGIDQTVRHVAALLYRNREALPGENPLQMSGADAVAESFRIIMNEGVASHIEQTEGIHFSPDHPTLGSVRIIPEDFFVKARDTIESFPTALGPLLGDRTQMVARGESFARRLAGGNAFTGTGLAMAAVISHHAGEDELRRVHRSPAAFLAAFQAAASRNPVPPPTAGAPGVDLVETVPPLAPEIYEPLQALLAEKFPAP
ncbi:hypothetical protein KDM41_00150 [bacterium]|nr:hypothetical protein [bacterium]